MSPVSLRSLNNRFMTFIDFLGCRLYEGIADGWRSSWDAHMRRRDAWWDGRRWGVVDNFHVKLTCIERLDVPASFCIGCAVE